MELIPRKCLAKTVFLHEQLMKLTCAPVLYKNQEFSSDLALHLFHTGFEQIHSKGRQAGLLQLQLLISVAVAYFNYKYTVCTCAAALLLSLTYEASRGPLCITGNNSSIQCFFQF